jgi:hypothetical protein
VVCRSGTTNYQGTDEPNAAWRNWNRDVSFGPVNLRHPENLQSLVEVVAGATELGQELHAYGSGWAFEDCTNGDGVMVRLDKLNQPLEYVVGKWGKDVTSNTGTVLIDEWRQVRTDGKWLVHFEAGIRVFDLCTSLAKTGLAMPVLGGANGQSLAGAFSTSTHGGDWNQPPFPDVVRAVHLITDGGQELWIERASNPITLSDNSNQDLLAALPCPNTKVVRDDRIFDAVRVALGRFGVIYSMVIEVRRQFRVVEVVTKPAAGAVLAALRQGQGTQSPFTPAFRLLNNDPVPPGLADATGVPYFLQILFNSQRPSDVWVTRRWETDAALPDIPLLPDPPKSYRELSETIIAVANTTLGLLVGTGGGVAVTAGTIIGSIIAGPFGGMIGSLAGASLTVTVTQLVAELDALLATGNAKFGSIVAAALTALWKIPGGALAVPFINQIVIDGDFKNKVQFGRRGFHHYVATGSKEDSDQEDFRVDSAEFIFDAMTPGYLNFLDEVLAIAPFFPQSGIISLRPSLSSSALLSMHHVPGRRAISIEIASVKNLPGNLAWFPYLESACLRHQGRPHWGQRNKLDEVQVATSYGDALNEWREALLSVSGGSMVFSNAFTRQRGLEPKGIAREVTAVKKRRGTITHLCNDGQPWSPMTVANAISQIQAGTARYVTRRNESRALIKVVRDGSGGFYLRTQSDRTSEDNLDNLPLSTAR